MLWGGRARAVSDGVLDGFFQSYKQLSGLLGESGIFVELKRVLVNGGHRRIGGGWLGSSRAQPKTTAPRLNEKPLRLGPSENRGRRFGRTKLQIVGDKVQLGPKTYRLFFRHMGDKTIKRSLQVLFKIQALLTGQPPCGCAGAYIFFHLN